MAEELADATIIESIQKGDKKAFGLLVLKYQCKVFRIISRYISDPSEILDLTQETFIKVYKSISHFRNESSFYTWLYRIAVNTAKTKLIEQDKSLPELTYEINDVERYASRNHIKDYNTPENLLISKEMEQILYGAIDELPHGLKTALILREIDGLTYDEIASTTHCPVGTIRSRIYRARCVIDEKIQNFLQK